MIGQKLFEFSALIEERRKMDPCARTPGQQENEENEDGLGMDSIRKKS